MLAAGDSFLSLTAEDLMSRQVVTIPQEMSLSAAARVMRRAQITGAPVVNTDGVCIGVVSATDFLHLGKRGRRTMPRDWPGPKCICSDWQVHDIEDLPVAEVRQYMTPNPVTVSPTTPLQDIARLMLDAHIHRVIVVDTEGRPVGVVSSTDLIATVARTEQ
jgi:CBS domain-containing protein